jgi:hypothetical protein
MEFKLPSKPTIRLVLDESEHDTPSLSPSTPHKKGRRRRFSSEIRPRVSDSPPHTQFAVIPSRAITDPRINRRKPLLLLLGAIGIHASAKGICYPSQRRLASLCGRSPSWAGKYLRELVALGYVRRLIPPRYRGPRAAWRLQVLWRQGNPIPENETSWETFPWCWSKKAPSDLET